MNIYEELQISEKPIMEYLEIEIYEKCNMNCRGCSHFSPLIENEKNFDFEGYQNDIIRLSNIFSNINVLRLLGGEPLLNQKLVEILKFTSSMLPNSDIRVVTNGIKIMSMSKELIECLVKGDVQLDISLYPIMKKSKQAIIEFLNNKAIRFNLNEVTKFASRINLRGDFNGSANSSKCKMKTVSLKEGKIYRCSILAGISKFQDYFGENIVQSDEGGKVDLYQYGGTEILNRIKEENKLCSYCSGNKDSEFDWSFSERKIEEWCI